MISKFKYVCKFNLKLENNLGGEPGPHMGFNDGKNLRFVLMSL
jgi:hypothetical protein